MSIYKLKINKKDVEIELSSKNPKLILSEYNLFMSQIFKEELEVIKQRPKAKKSIKKTLVQKEKSSTSDIPQNIQEQEQISSEEQSVKPTKLPENFAQMLTQKSNEESNVIEKKTSELRNTYFQMQQLISEKHLEDEVDYIVASAYCLTHYEKMSHFTEDQIKAKITPFFDNEIHHDYILDALTKNYLKLLPDFTGTSDTTEYSLTDTGEEYFLKSL